MQADGRWQTILNVVDHLPTHSAYGDAVAQDDELAAERAGHLSDGDDGADRGPSFTEWSPLVAALTDVADLLSLIRREMWLLAGQKQPPRHEARPRPIGAAERVSAALSWRTSEELSERLFGDTTT